MNELKILAIDDHYMFLEGVRHVLEHRFHPLHITNAGNAADAFAQIDRGDTFDLILLDLSLPGIDGFSLLRSFRQRQLWTPVLVVSASDDPQDAVRAITEGALGFVSKASPSTALLSAIESVLDGELSIPSAWGYLLGDKAEGESGPELTCRQAEVLEFMSQGLVNKQIADRLGMTVNTVKVHVAAIFKALDVHNRTACIVEAKRLGLLNR